MTRVKLPSISKNEKGFLLRLTYKEKDLLMKARGDFGLPMVTMIKQAIFEYYLPYQYDERKGK